MYVKPYYRLNTYNQYENKELSAKTSIPIMRASFGFGAIFSWRIWLGIARRHV